MVTHRLILKLLCGGMLIAILQSHAYGDIERHTSTTTSKYFGVNVSFPFVRSIRKNFFADEPQFRPMHSLKFGKQFSGVGLEAEAFYASLPMTAVSNNLLQTQYSVTFKSCGVLINLVKDLLQKYSWTLSAGVGAGVARNSTTALKADSLFIPGDQDAISVAAKNSTKGIAQVLLGVNYRLSTQMSLGLDLKYMYLNSFNTSSNEYLTPFNGNMHLGSINLNIKYHF